MKADTTDCEFCEWIRLSPNENEEDDDKHEEASFKKPQQEQSLQPEHDNCGDDDDEDDDDLPSIAASSWTSVVMDDEGDLAAFVTDGECEDSCSLSASFSSLSSYKSCLSSSTGKSSASKRRVSWNQGVQVQEYAVTLGQHPCNHDGLALTLDWYHAESVQHELEDYSPVRCCKYQMPRRLTFMERRDKLFAVSARDDPEQEGGEDSGAGSDCSNGESQQDQELRQVIELLQESLLQSAKPKLLPLPNLLELQNEDDGDDDDAVNNAYFYSIPPPPQIVPPLYTASSSSKKQEEEAPQQEEDTAYVSMPQRSSKHLLRKKDKFQPQPMVMEWIRRRRA